MMALLKSFRFERQIPSFYLKITGVILVMFLVLALWVRSPVSDINMESTKMANSQRQLEKGRNDGLVHEAGSLTDLPNESTEKHSNYSNNGHIKEDKSEDQGGKLNGGMENVEEELPEITKESELSVENVEKPKNLQGNFGKEPIGVSINKVMDSHFIEEPVTNGSLQSPGDMDTDDQKPLLVESTDGSQNKTEKETDPFVWKLCERKGAVDYIPCLDNAEAIKKLKSRRHFEHRERHCPGIDELQLCLVPLPNGYRIPIHWPRSRDEIWFNNVPHPKLVSYKKDQNWVRLVGDKLIFPGGGTQFRDGALYYINSIEKSLPNIAWGKRTRVVLDVGCGVASLSGYLFEKDVLTMSFAPNDEHEAQVQLALERGIPAILAVMGTQRLPFPSNVYDVVHCARCRVHWQGYGGRLIMEVNRLLRPGGYFVWSATPVYRKNPEDVNFWNEFSSLVKSMCWTLVKKTIDPSLSVGFAIYQKPTSNTCYDQQAAPLCDSNDNPNAAWYIPMEPCLHLVPSSPNARAADWPSLWPNRLHSLPIWLNSSKGSLFGKPATVEFQQDAEHWSYVVKKTYLKELDIDWSAIRNVMDMNSGYGGFAAALEGQSLWVMNVVPIDEPDTLPIIFDRGLIGIYHDWCESFNTYPRTYDLLHADHVFKHRVSRCNPEVTLLEMDRILRPQGWAIFREQATIMSQIDPIIRSLKWQIHTIYTKGEEQLLVVQKTMWRPETSTH